VRSSVRGQSQLAPSRVRAPLNQKLRREVGKVTAAKSSSTKASAIGPVGPGSRAAPARRHSRHQGEQSCNQKDGQ
jgi:hypothetical protein